MIKCILSKGDDPIQQISECLEIIKEIDKLYEKKKEIMRLKTPKKHLSIYPYLE